MRSTGGRALRVLLAAARRARTYAPAVMAPRWTPQTRFVILSMGRAGTELLVSLLDSHPEIVCDGELLNGYRPLSPELYVSARAAAAGRRGARAYGWKLLFHQFRGLPELGPEPDAYPLRLHERGWRIILLERLDLVQVALSHIRASDAREWHRTRDSRRGFAPITVDPMRLIATVYLLEEARAYGRSIGERVPHLRLVYERDLLDPRVHQATVARVCEFLGVAPAPTASEFVKVAPRRTREILANFEEIERALAGTRFERYLREPADLAAQAPAAWPPGP